jgi:hypothetical protein
MFVSDAPIGTEVNCADDAVTVVDTVNEFNEALEPDTMTRFHDGILYFLLDCG